MKTANLSGIRDEAGFETVSRTNLSIRVLGMSLGLFIAITYVICVAFDLLLPAYAMNPAWAPFLPGFTWLTWPSFFVGLVESFVYGWYVAVVFVPIYNFFGSR